jgi:transposase-like protein
LRLAEVDIHSCGGGDRGVAGHLTPSIRLRIRDGGAVRIKACHLAIGVDVDGIKRVRGMWIEQTEGARFWTGVLTELRNRANSSD